MSKKISFYAALGIQGNPAAGFIHSQLVDRVLNGENGAIKLSELAEVIFEDAGVTRDAIEFLQAEGLVQGLDGELVHGDSIRATHICVGLAKDQKGLDFGDQKPPIYRSEAKLDGRFYEMQAHKETPDGTCWFGNLYELDAIGGERIQSIVRGARFETRDELWAWFDKFTGYLGHEKPFHAWARTLPVDRRVTIGDDEVEVVYIDWATQARLFSEANPGEPASEDNYDDIPDGNRLYCGVSLGGWEAPDEEIEEFRNRPPIEDDDIPGRDEEVPAEDLPAEDEPGEPLTYTEELEGEFKAL